MWSSAAVWCPLFGLLAYVCIVWVGPDTWAKDRRQVWLLAAACLGVGALFFFPAWLIAALGYGTSLSQMLHADIPSWQFRKTVYLTYSLLVCGSLCIVHAVALHASRRPARGGS